MSNSRNKSENPTAEIDQTRRQALKVAAASAASATVLASTAASALQLQSGSPAVTSIKGLSTELSPELGEFSLQVHHSWASNDLAVVITNRGSQTRTITAMTPRRLELPRGIIDFDSLLQSGELTLGSGESVEVPLTPVLHKAAISGSGYGHFDRSIQNMLKERVTITTEADAYTAVTVVPGPMLV